MSPSEYSAIILDNLVKSLDILYVGVDYSAAVKEHSLGADFTTQDIELGYGLSAIQSNNSANLLNILVLGKGYSKSTLGGYDLIPTSGNETGLSLNNILSTSTIYENCYIIGSVFLSLDGSNNPVITANLFKPSGDPSSSDSVIIYKDISYEDVEKIVNNSTEIVSSSGYSVSLELFRFILDVDYYDGNLSSARAALYIIDDRKTRGVLTFAEENLAFSFMNALNLNYQLTQRIYNTTKSNIKTIINDWVSLSSWDPSFVGYWTTPGHTLPTNLKNFLENELGIIV
jgi:hypothetical protein